MNDYKSPSWEGERERRAQDPKENLKTLSDYDLTLLTIETVAMISFLSAECKRRGWRLHLEEQNNGEWAGAVVE